MEPTSLCQARPFCTQVVEKVRKVLVSLGKAWSDALERESALANSWCPSWQPVVGQLMSSDHAKLVLDMVKNPHFADLGGLAAKLQSAVALLKSVHKDGNPPMVESATIAKASQLAKLAVDTAVVTNAVFKARVEIPRTQDLAKNAEQATTVLALIKQNGTTVGGDVIEALTAITTM